MKIWNKDTVNTPNDMPRLHAQPLPLDFESLFQNPAYLLLKKHLYSFILRQQAVRQCLGRPTPALVLDIGAGISPMVESGDSAIITDISPAALYGLLHIHPKAKLAAADVGNLPFRTGVFSHAVCSEVLEHIADDRAVIAEIRRVLRPRGHLILTVPHRRVLYAYDDARVHHYRRYEIDEIRHMLRLSGFSVLSVRKVLGPLEKIAMVLVHRILSVLNRKHKIHESAITPLGLVLFRTINRLCLFLFRMDAWLAPLSMASVILVHAVRSETIQWS